MVRTRLKPKYDRGEPLPIAATGQYFEDIILNEVHGPVVWDIKASTHQRHCDLLDIHLPYFEEEQHLFPWEYMSWFRVKPQWSGKRINQGIHAGARYNYFKPAKVGEPISGIVINVDKYVKRGREILVEETINMDQSGEIISRYYMDNMTFMGRAEPLPDLHERVKARRTENWWKGAQPGAVPQNSPDLPIGYELPNHHAGPLPMRVSGFDAGGWDSNVWIKNIHSDEYAQSMGFKGGVVESPIVTEMGWLSTLVDFYGADVFFTTGKLDFKICGPGYIGDMLVGKFRVRERQKEGPYTRTILDVRVEKENGDLCQIGTASALDRIPEIEN